MSIVIAGYYGFGNAGDELILHVLIDRLRQQSPGVPITVLSKTPEETRRTFGVEAVDRWRPLAWVRPLFHASRFILGGGGLLQETTGPWNHFYYLSLLLAAKLFGCRTEVIAVGVDPVRLPLNRFWTRFVLNHWVDTISVRDEASHQALKRAGVAEPIQVNMDPVFDIKVERHRQSTGKIALALSPSRTNPQWHWGVAELCDLLAKRLDASVDLLVLFPKEDEKFARRVAEYAAFPPHVRLWEKPNDLVAWIPQYDVVVATRFHALVLAASAKVPFIGWGDQGKVAAVCRDHGKPFFNTEKFWNLSDQLSQIAALYQSGGKSHIFLGINKTDILPSR